MDVSRHLLDRASTSEEIALLPFTLSIVDCFLLYSAWSEVAQQRELALNAIVDGITSDVRIASVFDLYRFDRDIDEVAAFLEDARGNFVHWDERARFVAVGGSRVFCQKAAPYPQDVRKHYLLEGMFTLVPDDEIEELYAELTVPRP